MITKAALFHVSFFWCCTSFSHEAWRSHNNLLHLSTSCSKTLKWLSFSHPWARILLPSLSLVEYMTQIGKIEKDEDIRWIEFYDRKNTDLDFKLQIWLLFGLELIENKQMWKWWKWLKQETNIPNMTIIYWHEQNQQKQNKFWMITQNRPVMAR